MKILITGNMGYVGPSVIKQLRNSFPESLLIGYDIGYFGNSLTNAKVLPEISLDIQYFGDVRQFPEELLNGVDAVVHLAAISNDPMGNKYEDVTIDVNYKASIQIARLAKQKGVKSFVFASSCSVYGLADNGPRTEASDVNPLTAYAKSKVLTEESLKNLADKNFKITCLRFATACGMSDRLRLDLVLNDFVACALTSKKISILSDGTPWRPLINVKDMARAAEWAIIREIEQGSEYLIINVGSNNWNYQIKDLAYAVSQIIPGTEVSINTNALPDKRSYRVSFDLFNKLAQDYTPVYDLSRTIIDLSRGLYDMKFDDHNFREGNLMRLRKLDELKELNLLSNDLRWKK